MWEGRFLDAWYEFDDSRHVCMTGEPKDIAESQNATMPFSCPGGTSENIPLGLRKPASQQFAIWGTKTIGFHFKKPGRKVQSQRFQDYHQRSSCITYDVVPVDGMVYNPDGGR